MLIKSLKLKADERRKPVEKLADWLTDQFGSVWFLIVNAFIFLIWIVLNIDLIPGIDSFDPFPFGLLTMIVSLEAIVLSIIVLISQNREEKVNDLRGEANLQLDIHMEKEITRLLQIQKIIAEKVGAKIPEDAELNKMLKPTDMGKIEEILERQIGHK